MSTVYLLFLGLLTTNLVLVTCQGTTTVLQWGRDKVTTCPVGERTEKPEGGDLRNQLEEFRRMDNRRRRDVLDFDITIDADQSLSNLPAARQAFTDAEDFWEYVICGYQGDTSASVTISASAPTIDGPGGTLGQAGPTAGISANGFVYTTQGIMEFDSADLQGLEQSGALFDVIVHEMGHVLGVGTLWTNNGIFNTLTNVYSGDQANSDFKNEFSQQGSIPIEAEGGPGTAGGHWDETTNGATPTGKVNQNNNDFRNELMTGFLNFPTFMSDATAGTMRDMGYVLCRDLDGVFTTPDPSATTPITIFTEAASDSSEPSMAVIILIVVGVVAAIAGLVLFARHQTRQSRSRTVQISSADLESGQAAGASVTPFQKSYLVTV